MTLDLHIKYRPTTLDQVVGQEATVRALNSLLDSESPPHAYLFTGPSGVGKTTLARICATQLGADAVELVEVDAASTSGVDAARKLTEPLRYKGLGGGIKAVIVDECHALSKAAWQALLKILEEPPSHVYFMLCTTEADKVPRTIKTRCHSFTLDDVGDEDIEALLLHVIAEEELEIREKALRLIVESSQGSPRLALVLLSTCRGETSTSGVRKVLTSQAALVSEKQVIDLCRALIFKPSFAECLDIIRRVKEEGLNPESVRLQVVNYAAAVALSAKQRPKVIDQCLRVMDAFQGEFNSSEKWAPVLLACANATMD